jgi:hypothetical protein
MYFETVSVEDIFVVVHGFFEDARKSGWKYCFVRSAGFELS